MNLEEEAVTDGDHEVKGSQGTEAEHKKTIEGFSNTLTLRSESGNLLAELAPADSKD